MPSLLIPCVSSRLVSSGRVQDDRRPQSGGPGAARNLLDLGADGSGLSARLRVFQRPGGYGESGGSFSLPPDKTLRPRVCRGGGSSCVAPAPGWANSPCVDFSATCALLAVTGASIYPVLANPICIDVVAQSAGEGKEYLITMRWFAASFPSQEKGMPDDRPFLSCSSSWRSCSCVCCTWRQQVGSFFLLAQQDPCSSDSGTGSELGQTSWCQQPEKERSQLDYPAFTL